jgi:hypothetical protein
MAAVAFGAHCISIIVITVKKPNNMMKVKPRAIQDVPGLLTIRQNRMGWVRCIM